ncbi:MAG: hypothetical protein NZ518_03395 [Dehalococcoidia bacterium]|nr:hypothetical protein [Dehalococcoidia bacterium]
MSRGTKLVLDIVMGAVLPILILNYLSEPLSAPVAYVVSALVPVGWVVVDLLLITKRFNFITTFVGLSAITRGALAFWFVDGVLYAIKDTASTIVAVVLMVAMVAARRPILQFFVTQGLGPDTPERERLLGEALREPSVWRAMLGGAWLMIAANVVTGVANFALNVMIVTAPFGTIQFNEQVAQVNAITRVALAVPEFLAVGAAIWLVIRALFATLPAEPGKTKMESDVWAMLALREQLQRPAIVAPDASSNPA